MKTKAFTLVELMICVTIAGLLLAMAIPAYVKIKERNIIKKAEAGEALTREEQAFYREHTRKQAKAGFPTERAEDTRQAFFDGIRYRIIKKEDLKEVVVDGQIVYLIKD